MQRHLVVALDLRKDSALFPLELPIHYRCTTVFASEPFPPPPLVGFCPQELFRTGTRVVMSFRRRTPKAEFKDSEGHAEQKSASLGRIKASGGRVAGRNLA